MTKTAEASVLEGEVVHDTTEQIARTRNAVATPRASRSRAVATAEPMNLIQMALDKGAGIEVIKELVTLQERLDATAARKAFNLAISAAKAELPIIVKNRRVKFESTKADVKDGKVDYAHEDMAGIAEQIDPILGQHGLTYRFRSSQPPDRGVLSVTCIVSHELGFFEETTLSAGVDLSGAKNHLQGIGSAATYLQRYTLKLALGLAAAEDDDGNGTGNGVGVSQNRAEPQQQKPSVPRASQQQARTAAEAAKETVPHTINTTGLTYSALSLEFIRLIKTANDVATLEAWDKLNDAALNQMYHDKKGRPIYDELNKAYLKQMEMLKAKAAPRRDDPISSGPIERTGKAIDKWGAFKWGAFPDPATAYEEFLAWASATLQNWKQENAEHLEAFWNEVIEPAVDFPGDKDDLMSEYRKAEQRLGG